MIAPRRVAAVALVLFAIALWSSATGSTPIWNDPPAATPTGGNVSPTTLLADAGLPADTLPDEPSPPDDAEVPVLVENLLLGLLLVGLIAAAIVLRRRWRVGWLRPRSAIEGFAPLPDIAGAITDDAVEQLSALSTGSPRNAVVACWVRLEDTVASAGLPRDPAETSSEFTQRVLRLYAVDTGAIGELAALYREARFSAHDINEGHRERAVAALQQLHRDLGREVTR